MKKIFLILITFFCSNLKSQTNACVYWSTYLGAELADDVKGLTVDANKNTYVIAQTSSSLLPVLNSAITNSFSGFYDAYLAKFDSCGVLKWSTYLGTTGFDSGEKICMSPDGNIVFTGYTQAAGLPTLAAYQPTFGGQNDCFIGKINPNGNLIWFTYFGKAQGEAAYDIKCDNAGAIYIGGTAISTNVATPGAFQTTQGGAMDAFIAKFSSTGNLRWCTYYGGSGSEDIHALATDNQANVIGVGGTNSFNLSTSVNCLQASKDALFDCYIIKLDSAGNRIFSTYLGGNGQDDCNGVCADNNGNIYLGGITASSNFTTTVSAFQPSIAGMNDCYITKLNTNGNLVYSSFLGGTDDDAFYRNYFFNNKVYFFGTTASSNFPVVSAGTNSVLSGNQNINVVIIDQNNGISKSIIYGSNTNGYDYLSDAFVTLNTIHFSGKTGSASYPTSVSAFQPTLDAPDDGIITKLSYTNTLSTVAVNKNNNMSDILVFPNPCSDYIFVKGNFNELQLYNLIGEKVISSNTNKVDVRNLEKGIYFLSIDRKNVLKIVRQ